MKTCKNFVYLRKRDVILFSMIIPFSVTFVTYLFCLLQADILVKNTAIKTGKRQLPYYHKSLFETSDSTILIVYIFLT